MNTLVIYGLLQEKIMRVPYGERKEYFRFSLFIVFCNRITTSAVSAATLLASKKALDLAAPIYKYCAISLSNMRIMASLNNCMNLASNAKEEGNMNLQMELDLQKLELELSSIIWDMKILLYKQLVPSFRESRVFYYKMCGNYYRYLGEFISDQNEKKEETAKSLKSYPNIIIKNRQEALTKSPDEIFFLHLWCFYASFLHQDSMDLRLLRLKERGKTLIQTHLQT